MQATTRVNLFLLTGSHAVNAFYTQLLIPVLPLIKTEFDLSYVQTGLIVSVYAAANSIFQFPFSFLSDFTGRWRTALSLSLFTQALPVLLYGYASDYPLLLLFVFVSGIGSAAYHPPAVALITREMPGRRGFCMGLFGFGGEVGNILTPLLVGALAVWLASWRAAAQTFLLPGLVWAALIWFRFRDQGREVPSLRAAAASAWREIFLNPPLVMLSLFSACRIMGYRGLMAFTPLFMAQALGLDVGSIGRLLTLMFVLGAFSTLLLSQLSDRFDRGRLLVWTMLATAAAIALIPWVRSAGEMAGLLLLLGFVMLPAGSLVLAISTELVGRAHRSTSVGLVYGVNEGVSSFSPALGGLIAQTWGLGASFYFFALMFALGAAAGWLLGRLRVGGPTPGR